MAVRDSRSDMLPSDSIAGDGGPAEAASLISAAVAELTQLAHRHRLDMLAHLLDMAKLEADEFGRRQTASAQF
ncbi:MAG: hypothetical protein E6Q28_16830 [Afipia sp.]|nr:MAG: hypothetical protein E6Q28_16830 [Afipia sp.]